MAVACVASRMWIATFFDLLPFLIDGLAQGLLDT